MDENKPILFFDGFCNLCDGLISFLIKWNKGQFYFAPLQGQAAKIKLSTSDIEGLNTIIFLDKGIKYTQSRAVLRIFWHLGGFFKIFSFFKIVPQSISDFLYNWVSKNRYKWFGKKESCRLPTEVEKKLFLD
jgi:predicted DCC family thiol-disulfide oxidoreductase YuxK